MITLNELKTYYKNLLINQYRNKTNARATIGAMVSEIWLDGLPMEEAVCFDIDTAVGAQLDIIGRIIGVNREIPGLDLTNTYFEFTDYSATAGTDFASYSDLGTTGILWRRYFVDAVTNMVDDQMRAVIKLKIIFNCFSRSMKKIKEALYAEFSGSIDITDNLDLSLDFDFSDPYHQVADIADFINILPKTMGISYTINKV